MADDIKDDGEPKSDSAQGGVFSNESMAELLKKWSNGSGFGARQVPDGGIIPRRDRYGNYEGRGGRPQETRLPGGYSERDFPDEVLEKRGWIPKPQKRDAEGNLKNWKEGPDLIDTSMLNESWSERIDRMAREGAAKIIAGDPKQVRNQLNFKLTRIEKGWKTGEDDDFENRVYQFTASCPESVSSEFVTDSRRIAELRKYEKDVIEAAIGSEPGFLRQNLNEMEFAIAQGVDWFERRGWHICIEENIAWENKEKRQICFCPTCVEEVKYGNRAGWTDR